MTIAEKPLSKRAQKEKERQEAIEQLRRILKPGDTVYCVLRHVSSSGMSRRIDFYKLCNGDRRFLSGYMRDALGYRQSDKGGLVVGGCGMDMGFAVVYELGRTLFPKGFKLAKGQHGRNGDKSGRDEDGGYALRHEWL